MNPTKRRQRRGPRRRPCRIEALQSRRLLAAAPDLVQFAKDLDSAGVKFYCAAWFEGCTTQTRIFEDGAKYLPFTEVTGSDQQINQDGIDAMIIDVPAWDFPSETPPGQTRHEGFLELEDIGRMSGVPIPMSETPSFDTLGPQTVLIGSPLHVPVDAYDPDGNELTVTVTVAGSITARGDRAVGKPIDSESTWKDTATWFSSCLSSERRCPPDAWPISRRAGFTMG